MIKTASFGERYSELAAEWHPTLNGDTTPYDVTSSNRVTPLSWLCSKCGGTWNASTVSRVRSGKLGCPPCNRKNGGLSRKTPKTFEESVAHLYPHLLEEWNADENSGKTLSEFKPGSDAYGMWTCNQCNHVWTAQIKKRTLGRGCPICAQSKREIKNSTPKRIEESLGYLYPELVKDWNHSLNSRTPFEYYPRSGQLVWWTCSKGHNYESTPQDRTRKGTGCHYCSGHRPLVGVTDLWTLQKELVDSEWDFERNTTSPSEYTEFSSRKAWWKCSKGHSWETLVIVRTSMNCGCPECSNNGVSVIEQNFRNVFSTILSNCNENAKHRTFVHTLGYAIQVDITGVYKGRKVAIEYDGRYYHQTDAAFLKDTEKTQGLLEDGWTVIRIRDRDLAHLEIKHERLYQITHDYTTKIKEIEDGVQRVINWLDTLSD